MTLIFFTVIIAIATIYYERYLEDEGIEPVTVYKYREMGGEVDGRSAPMEAVGDVSGKDKEA